MKKHLLTVFLSLLFTFSFAQKVSVKWELGDKDNLNKSLITGSDTYTKLLSTSYLNGNEIKEVRALTASNSSEGYQAVSYDPVFASYYVNSRVTSKTVHHNVAFGVKPSTGHKFKPTKISFDACKVGTDGGNFDVYVKTEGETEKLLASSVSPLRNRVGANNPDACSHHEYSISDYIVEGKSFILLLYIYNINGLDAESPKSIAFRNVQIDGVVDEEIFTASHFISSFTCQNAQGETIDLLNISKDLKNAGLARYKNKLYGKPENFEVKCFEGYTSKVDFSETTATVRIYQDGVEVFYFEVLFTITNREPKPAAKPLSRGLMAVSLSGAGMGTGNLVSWRLRENDPDGYSYKLYRGSKVDTQTTVLNGGKAISGKSNYLDAQGSTSSFYKLEVLDSQGNVIETQSGVKVWAKQTFEIPVTAPIDLRNGALYNPNDASFCDMDGDGEYEIILKWSPGNEKDAASSGTTSNIFFDCLKLDGTMLWRIDMGQNFFASAHTMQFIAWDFDGDGYGEFMVKTAPGTVDGEGNYVIMGNDDPLANWKNSRGKQVSGPEYITVFDGMTGAELSTIPYHTNYAAGENYWGDSNQNRSERYLAALAYLDGYDSNPSPIFARGYYSGAFVGAYDWDGETLKERWVSRNTTSGKGLWGEGAHWISVGDCDQDGKQEIIFGSAALDHDGSLLYRTGLGHGDALHLGDFLTERPGLEVLMCHEHKPYGIDIRDAKTGEILLHQTESGDTGRGLAAHFDSSQKSAQFLTSARAQMYNMVDGSVNANSWAIGSSGAGINARIYWDGDLFDEFFDKSIIAHWNPTGKYFDRYKVNNGNYTYGTLNNYSKNNPCVLGDILGDWREEIITHDGAFDKSSGAITSVAKHLIINATSYESKYPVPHLMDDPQYRVQIVNQNCCYNQPPHLSYDPAVRFGAIIVDPTPHPVEKKGDLAEGSYYIQNAKTGTYLLGGSFWGTRAIVGAHGIDFGATLVADNSYNLDSKISNGSSKQYLSADNEPYVDSPAATLIIKKLSNGNYTINNGTGYLEVNPDGDVTYSAATNTSASAQWRFVTLAEMTASLSNASEKSPVDATFFIKDPDFGRNDQRYSSWTWSSDCTNNNNSGNESNMNVESYHSTFTFSQKLAGIPNGWYLLSAQGFYRTDGDDKNIPVFFANSETVEMTNVLTEGQSTSVGGFTTLNTGVYIPNSMKEASEVFTAGYYASKSILFEVTDGTANIGVSNADGKNYWCIWDNFELSYYGSSKPSADDPIDVAIDHVSITSNPSSYDIHTLQGVKLHSIATPGIYIINGKKVLVR